MSDDIDFGEKAEFIVKCLENGYTVETADVLYYNHVKRKEILARAEGRKLTDEERQEIARIREYDKDIIEYDWKTNQPEKYALNYIKKLSVMNNKIDAATDDADKEKLLNAKQDFMDKNKDWVNQNQEVVKEVIMQITKKKTFSVVNNLSSLFGIRDR